MIIIIKLNPIEKYSTILSEKGYIRSWYLLLLLCEFYNFQGFNSNIIEFEFHVFKLISQLFLNYK